jgi:flagellin-like hook-associated protein FlgL
MRNLQFNAKGEAMSYLKGDIIKVQAHWNDPNSFVFLKALNDVPQNLLIDELLLSGIGTGKYFEFVGSNQTSDGKKDKPTTQFGLPNKEYATPEKIDDNSVSSLRKIMENNMSNNYTPTFVQSSGDGNIYRPLNSDWGIKTWSQDIGTYKEGELVYAPSDNDSLIYQISDKVKGNFSAGKYAEGDFVFNNGWYIAKDVGDVDGDQKGYAEVIDGEIRMRSESVVANYTPGDTLTDGSEAKHSDGKWYKYEVTNLPPSLLIVNDLTELQVAVDSALVSEGDLVFLNDDLKEVGSDDSGNVTADTPSLQALIDNGAATEVTDKIESNGTLWAASSWESVADPLNPTVGNEGFAEDKTQEYTNLSNKNVWSKTYYGALDGVTINKDYERGDNIFYQGKHYVYVSHLSSSDESFGGEAGVNNFQQLLLGGALKELGVYVDTVGAGGSSDKSKDSFYAANQDLEYVDRLPDSGEVRTSGVQRRGDPMQNGDGIFNSLDDQLYNSLNPGNDGIYGTMDDFYSTTPYGDVAASAAHTDSDADNNRDLLDTANDLGDFSVADFVDYIQTVANFRAVNGGTMSRLNYASRILEENRINLESAHGRIMNADIALESSKLAKQNVLIQASAAMITQANQMNQIVLQLLQ